MMNVVFLLQALAWPVCVAWIVWALRDVAARWVEMVKAQALAEAAADTTARADAAMRAVQRMRDEFEAERANTRDEIGVLKAGLVERLT